MKLVHYFKVFLKVLYRETVKYAIWHFSSYFPYLQTFMFEKVRAVTWRWLGATVGKNCGIGYGIYLDVPNMRRLLIGNNVAISSEVLILLHRKDISKYFQGMTRPEIPMIEDRIIIEDNVQIGMRAVIMPGVTIGHGAVVGANSVVTKNIPPFAIVAGQPARIIKMVPKKNEIFECYSKQ